MLRGLILFLLLSLLVLFASQAKSSAQNKKKSFNKDDYKLFIIAGTQKSGTTVLSGLLSEHPLIAFSKKKELHFFDKEVNYQKGIRHYLNNFAPKENSIYIGEATPYYIASRDACERIADDFPDVKMIVMLREPIERAYSEYQMKVRRVEKQNKFYSMLLENIGLHRECFMKFGDDIDGIKNATCLPLQIREHVSIKKLIVAMKKSLTKNITWNEVMTRCFPISLHDPPTLTVGKNPCLSLPSDLRGACSRSQESIKQGFFWLSKYVNQSLKQEREYFNVSVYRSYFEEQPYTWDPKACFKDHPQGHEKLLPIYTALVEEAVEFDKCATLNKEPSEVPLLTELPQNEEEDAIFDLSLEWALDRLEQVDDAIDRCIRVKGGITSQYFYRSMYAVQLYKCFSSIDPEQFLIIPSGDMRNNPAEVLRRVLDFLELPINHKWIKNVTSRANEFISEKYQEFAKTTSWQLQSEYEPLAPDIRHKLVEFFSYHNELLFRLVGEDYSPYW